MKRVLLLAAILIFSVNLYAQTAPTGFDLTNYGVKIEPDKRVMVVLAALEAAGVDTPLTADGEKFRGKLKTDLLGLSPELRQKMVVFIEQHKKRFAERYKQNLTDEEKNSFGEFLEKSRRGLNEEEKKFFTEKYKRYFNELIAPFVSMAYSLAPAPELTDPKRSTDLPGDLLDVLDFAPLVREFYRASLKAEPESVLVRTKIDEYAAKDYQTAGTDLRPSAYQMVGELLDYLHTKPQLTYIERIKTQTKDAKGKKTLEKVELRERERRFYIVPEMLAPKGTINFVNVGDVYYAIVPPQTDLSQSEVRRAYLQFVIDPLVLSNAKDLATMRDGIKTLLDAQRKQNPDISPDFFLAVTRSLVAAAEARQIEFEKTQIATVQARRKIDQMQTVDEKKAVSAGLEATKKLLADETALQLSDAYERGAVLSFYFADQLKGLEDSGFDIAGSLRDIILSFDATKETNRLAQFADARKRAIAAREERRRNTGSQEFVVENPVTKRLLEIDQLTKAKNYVESEKQLKLLLAANPSEARVYYALGRVASLSAESITDEEARKRRLVEAKTAYENALTAARTPDQITKRIDSALISLSYVALARIYEFYGETAYAVKIYEAAINVGNVTDGAYNEAVAARDRLMKEQ